MAALTDWCCKLKDNPMFDVLRKNVSKLKPSNESKGLLSIKDGYIYLWDSYASILLTANLKWMASASSDETRQRPAYQTLACTNTPVFDVDFIGCNQSGTHIFVAGRRGITIILLPERVGRFGEFEGGTEKILARSLTVNERGFVTSEFVLLHAIWHPGSPTSTHLILLTSDNFIRIYDIAVSCDCPESAFCLGQMMSGITNPLSPSKQAIVLGDTVVSFDIGGRLDLGSDEKQAGCLSDTSPQGPCVWPVYLLLGNGEVYRLLTSVGPNKVNVSQPLTGPLRMYPAAEDNYGMEACSILCLQTHLPVLVVATSEGKLHHCLLLSQPPEDEDSRDPYNTPLSSARQSATIPALFVYETVELELSLTTVAIETDELLTDYFSCPLRLLRDPASNERYHCSHSAGLHSLVLPWSQKLQHFCETDEAEVSMPIFANQHSIVEHLICTKPLRSSPVSPVLGICVVSNHMLGTKIVCLTSTLECVILPLMPTYNVDPLPLLSDRSVSGDKSPLRQLYKEPFDSHIRKILQRNSSNPIIKSSPTSEPTSQECLKLVVRATQVFREEYIQKLEQAREEFERRVRVLQTLRNQQQAKLHQFERDRHDIAEKSELLKEKYANVDERQHSISLRIEALLQRLQQRSPILSNAERDALKELKEIESLLHSYTSRIKTIGRKMHYQADTIENQTPSSQGLRPTATTRASALTDRQMQNVHVLLKKEGEDIANLVKQINILQSALVS